MWAVSWVGRLLISSCVSKAPALVCVCVCVCVCARAGAFETQEEIKSLPTQLTAHIVLPQIYTSLEPSKMPSAEKVL